MPVNVTITRTLGGYKKGGKLVGMPLHHARQLVALGIGKIDEEGDEVRPRKKRAYKRRDMQAE